MASNLGTPARLNNALKEIETKSKQLDEALQENAVLKAEVSHLLDLQKKGESELEKLRLEGTNLQRDKYDLEAQMLELRQKVEEERSEVEQERQVAVTKETKMRDEVRKLREKDEQLQAQLEECCGRVEDQKKIIALVTKERDDRDRSIDVLKSQAQKDQAHIDNLTGDLMDLRAKMAKMENDSEDFSKKIEMKCTALQNERDNVRSEKEALQVQCTTHLTRIAKLETTCRDAQTQIKVLEEEKARLVRRKEDYRRELQKASKERDDQVKITAQQMKLYESDFAKERAQREKLVLDYESLNKRLTQSNIEKRSLQQDINSLTARLQKYEEGGGGNPYPPGGNPYPPGGNPYPPECQENMRRMAGELEMASRCKEELRSQNLKLEAELRRCYKHIEDQKKTIEEERIKNQVKSVVKEIMTVFHDERETFEASCGPVGFQPLQRYRSQSVPEAQSFPYHSGPPPPMAPEGEGVCPICGRKDFKSPEDLVLHSAQCTDFKK